MNRNSALYSGPLRWKAFLPYVSHAVCGPTPVGEGQRSMRRKGGEIEDWKLRNCNFSTPRSGPLPDRGGEGDGAHRGPVFRVVARKDHESEILGHGLVAGW